MLFTGSPLSCAMTEMAKAATTAAKPQRINAIAEGLRRGGGSGLSKLVGVEIPEVLLIALILLDSEVRR